MYNRSRAGDFFRFLPSPLLGRRFKEVVGQYQRWFVYDMGSSETPGLEPLLAEYDESGNLVAKYY